MINYLKKIYRDHFLLIVLSIGLIHGLIYVFLIPPWQHYDEPGHFEYAWMIANHDSFPQKGEYDNEIRLEILESMKKNEFFKHQNIDYYIDFVDSIRPVWIGITQVGDPPLYYILASIPLMIFKNQTIDFQLISTRFVSLLLFLGILYVAVLFAKEVFRQGHPGRFLFPLTLCLIPSFVDHMTALNNDVAAVLVNSIIIYLGYKLIKHGFNWKYAGILVLFGIVAVFVKASIWLSFSLAIMALIFSVSRIKKKYIILVFVAIIFLSLVFIFDCGDAALWYKKTSQISPTRVETQYGTAFFLNNKGENQSSSLTQAVPIKYNSDLAGQVVTLAVSVWGEDPSEIKPPTLMVLTNDYELVYLETKPINISETPALFVTHIQIPTTFNRLFVMLRNNEKGSVFFLNPVLVVGEWPTTIEPIFIDSKNSVGVWNGEEFENVIRNSSVKNQWPRFKPIIVNLFEKIDNRLSGAVNRIIYSLDLEGTSWYLQQSFYRLFRTFWGVFGWGNVALIGSKPYRLPLFFTIISIILSLLVIKKDFFSEKVYLAFWLFLFIVFSSGYAWFTGISMNSLFNKAYLPVARFIYPVIFPILLLLVMGWANLIQKSNKFFRWSIYTIYFVFFLFLDILAIISIVQYI